MFAEILELIEIARPRVVPERLGDQRGQPWVAIEEPAPRRDSVGLVAEFAWIKLIELREEIGFEQLRVERSHAIDGVRSHHG